MGTNSGKPPLPSVTEGPAISPTHAVDAQATRVLVVDDDEQMRRVMGRVLARAGYDCTLASSGSEALALLGETPYELMVADVNMPGESGLDLARQVRAKHPDTAIVMATGIDDPAIASVALEQGAFGYMVKPFAPNELLINAANALLRRRLECEARDRREELEQMVEERTRELRDALADVRRSAGELRLSRQETIRRLARAVEYRDLETGGHIERMSHYAGLLAEKIGLPDERSELIRLASPLHDVGKIGISDGILLKPGKLTEDERRTMQSHAEIGFRILSGSPAPLLETAAVIALTHHEKVDGSGYPRALFGNAIPLEGRIAAVADVFDALTTDRVYRPAFSVDKALDIMREGRGTHFDAQILDAFLASLDEFLAIKERYEAVEPVAFQV